MSLRDQERKLDQVQGGLVAMQVITNRIDKHWDTEEISKSELIELMRKLVELWAEEARAARAEVAIVRLLDGGDIT